MVSEHRRNSTFTGTRYYRNFIKSLRKDVSFEDLDEEQYIIHQDTKLGLLLIHAGLASEDSEHYRHRLTIVVNRRGKASACMEPGSVVAHILSCNYTSGRAICDALLKSFTNEGARVVVGPRRSSPRKCPECGHDAYWEPCSKCVWNAEYEIYLCGMCQSAWLSSSNWDGVNKKPVPPGWWSRDPVAVTAHLEAPTEPEPGRVQEVECERGAGTARLAIEDKRAEEGDVKAVEVAVQNMGVN